MNEFDFGDSLPEGKVWSDDLTRERWRRVREDIDHQSLVLELTKAQLKSGAIRCPMGGHRDSTPSFFLYGPSRGNSSHCFGCPPGKQDRDNVGFISDYLEMSPTQALLWLEKHYHLPPLVEEEKQDSTQEGSEWLVTVTDLLDPYVNRCARILKTTKDPQEALKFIRILWDSQESENPIQMANVLGRKRIEELISRKAIYDR